MVTRDVLKVLKLHSPTARAILRTFKTSLVPINHEMHSRSYDFLYIYSFCEFILHKYNASRIVSFIHFQNANILAILCLAHLCKSRKTLVKKINSNLNMCFFFLWCCIQSLALIKVKSIPDIAWLSQALGKPIENQIHSSGDRHFKTRLRRHYGQDKFYWACGFKAPIKKLFSRPNFPSTKAIL